MRRLILTSGPIDFGGVSPLFKSSRGAGLIIDFSHPKETVQSRQFCSIASVPCGFSADWLESFLFTNTAVFDWGLLHL